MMDIAGALKVVAGLLGAGRTAWSWLEARWGHPLRVDIRPTAEPDSLTLGTRRIITANTLQSAPKSLWEVPEWLRTSHGAHLMGQRRDDLTLRSTSRWPIVVNRVHARVQERNTQRWGAAVHFPPGAANEAMLLGLDLSTSDGDVDPVVVQQCGDYEWTSQKAFPDRDITLQPGCTQSISLLSRTGADAVKWRLVIHYSIRGNNRTVEYPGAQEEPFLTVGGVDVEQFWMSGIAGLEAFPWLRQVSRQEFMAG